MRLPEAEGRIASLCLQYLTLPGFETNHESGNRQLHEQVKTGFFAFLNYAALHWVDHLQSYLETLQPVDMNNLENLAPVGEEFFSQHGPADNYDLQSCLNALGSTRDLREECKEAKHHWSFETLIMLIVQARYLRQKDDSFLGLGTLGDTVQVARETLELQIRSQDSTSAVDLSRFYGDNMFQCPRHQCYYFHEGFQDLRLRQEHVQRHDRPFCCKEEGCSRTQTGFCTDAALQKHIKKNHVDVKVEIFIKPKPKRKSKETSQSEPKRQRREKKTNFPCDLCPKQFTRASTLVEHVRTHTGERPFVCNFCEHRFARVKDCQRHKTIHTRGNTFACNGTLDNGIRWGCGRKYTRADALARHFSSSLGRNCLQPLCAQQNAGNVQISHGMGLWPSINTQEALIGVSFEETTTGRYANEIPAAVFSQFPEFEDLDWSALAETPSESAFI